jgi:flavin-binding protein dodecin
MSPGRSETPKPSAAGAAKAGGASSDKVYKIIEVVGTSRDSIADAVRTAVRVASKTVHGISWFEVSEIRGAVADGQITDFQTTVKLGFRVEDR